MDPMELNRFLEANIDDPATIAELLDQYYPQTIGVTGTKETTPRSIRDIGNVTKIAPGEKLEGTEIKEPDLAAGLKPAVTGGTKPGATKPASSGPNLDSLMKALMLMQRRPQEQKEQYQLANMPDYEDLMYGLSSGETPYMRG
jgi:hypothetical protein